MGELSYLLMGAFDLKGSFLYRMFPGPRYAFRELSYRRIIAGGADPSRFVSGDYFLRILGNVLSLTGEEAAMDAEAERRRLLEEVNASLRKGTGKAEGLSSEAESIQEYEGDFELE
jgi:hypothetical protein